MGAIPTDANPIEKYAREEDEMEEEIKDDDHDIDDCDTDEEYGEEEQKDDEEEKCAKPKILVVILKQGVIGLLVQQQEKPESGWKHLIMQSNRIDLEGHRPRVRRYAHGLKDLIRIGQGPEALLRRSSSLGANFASNGYFEADAGDVIEAHEWKCVRTINGVRFFEDMAESKGERLRIGRSSLYHFSLVADLGSSQRSPNLKLSAAGLTPTDARGLEGSDLIYIGPLPRDFTGAELRKMLEEYDPLLGFDLAVDCKTGHSKHYALTIRRVASELEKETALKLHMYLKCSLCSVYLEPVIFGFEQFESLIDVIFDISSTNTVQFGFPMSNGFLVHVKL
ncbi:hypothetical protein RJ639_020837 [Escallonia herrerae]|uniref:RRM domain-containing protein n=1 Tax=Escallonia herrerae TaxID=1293975 RepID=A0AA88V2S8_9ASTE|nr:hypothetical protein RJ639_020837 [Escallonia herrerae]